MSVICMKCRHEAPASAFAYGVKGDGKFQHPDHRYCPNCGASIDWYGYKVSANLPTIERMTRLVGRVAKSMHELATLQNLQKKHPTAMRAAQIEVARHELRQEQTTLESLEGYNVTMNIEGVK